MGCQVCNTGCVLICNVCNTACVLILLNGSVAGHDQLCVALSRAKKRLIVVHGLAYNKVHGEIRPHSFYPVLGPCPNSSVKTIRVGEKTWGVPQAGDHTPLSQTEARVRLTEQIVDYLAIHKVIEADPMGMPSKLAGQVSPGDASSMVYTATSFAYFAASEERRFLGRARFRCEESSQLPIVFDSELQFEKTKEDVSAVYGKAVEYMLQWDTEGFCADVEAVTESGVLVFEAQRLHKGVDVGRQILQINAEFLSKEDENMFFEAFKEAEGGRLRGRTIIDLINKQVRVIKRRTRQEAAGSVIEIAFRVIALDQKKEDELMRARVPEIRKVYEKAVKSAADWCYIANAVMAFRNYHNRFAQIGTDAASYQRWVNEEALVRAVVRLRQLMQPAAGSGVQRVGGKLGGGEGVDGDGMEGVREGTGDAEQGGGGGREDYAQGFEVDLAVWFDQKDSVREPGNPRTVIGVQGRCDWAGQGLVSPEGTRVDLLEIKLAQELSNSHRLQVLVYCALFSRERMSPCTALLYNARTGESETCTIDSPQLALEILLDLATFKYNGTVRIPASEAVSAGERQGFTKVMCEQ